ncbi:MAG: hypothetical protein IT555_06790 [Acetobacteraceae bacterium]|nr:hypothetical protein [Acetobacteraceae bacterium]
MPHPEPVPVDDDTAEAAALAAAVALARADDRSVSHAAMRHWLLRVADGEVDAPPPVPRRV